MQQESLFPSKCVGCCTIGHPRPDVSTSLWHPARGSEVSSLSWGELGGQEASVPPGLLCPVLGSGGQELSLGGGCVWSPSRRTQRHKQV